MLRLAGMWEMEIQGLHWIRAKQILELGLSTLELYMHFYNCVTHGWFWVTSENRTHYLTVERRERKENRKKNNKKKIHRPGKISSGTLYSLL